MLAPFFLVAFAVAVVSATEAVSRNASMPECIDAMDGKLPAYYPPSFKFSGNVRKYYIAAEIEEWDYMPSGWDNWLGVPANQSFRVQNAGFTANDSHMGTKYDKAVYRGYTDETFEHRSEVPPWLGLQGPILRAELGDMIEILFINRIPDFVANLHSMGLFYSKEFEGSVYYNTSQFTGPGDAVYTDYCFVYKWLVTGDLAPPNGENSRLLGYHAFVSMPADTDTGLYGANIIYNPGTMEATMNGNREFVMAFTMQDESNSFLVKHNVEKYLPEYYERTVNQAILDGNPYPGTNWSYWDPQSRNSPFTGDLKAACPLFFAVNGYIFSNAPEIEACQHDPAIWYIYNLGDDGHAVHWHGHNVEYQGTSVPTVPSTPGVYDTYHMTCHNPGIWQVLCHFTVHKNFGLDITYHVYEKDCPLPPLKQHKLFGIF